MELKNNFMVLNIREYLESKDKRLDEESLKQLFSEFACPLNPDVEHFLKYKAIEFTRKHQAVTYLVLSREDAALLGYFSITIKPLVINAKIFSGRVKRKFARFSKIEEKEQIFNLSAYLIAQLGKNCSDKVKGRITGRELLEVAMKQIQILQYQVGGMVAFVEAEDKKKLLSFYENYGFKPFSTRYIISNKKESRELVQLLKII